MPLNTAYAFSFPRTADDNALLDELACIITNGIESGYIDYWALTLDYQWSTSPGELDEYPDTKGRKEDSRAILREHNESDNPLEHGPTFHLTPETLLPAVLRIVNGTAGLSVHSDLPGRLLALLRAPGDEHDFDAEDADILIQLAVLGEIVYG